MSMTWRGVKYCPFSPLALPGVAEFHRAEAGIVHARDRAFQRLIIGAVQIARHAAV